MHTQTCNESLVNFFNQNLGYVAGVGTAFGVFEVSTFIYTVMRVQSTLHVTLFLPFSTLPKST